MKLLLVNRHRDDVIGGSEIQCDLLARRLSALGHEVTYGVAQPRRAAYSTGYDCRPLREPLARSFGSLVRELRPDVVYWRFNKPSLLACVRQARSAGATFLFAFSHDDDGRLWPALGDVGGATRMRRAWRRAGAWWRRLQGTVDWLGHGLVHGHVAQHAQQTVRGLPITRRVIRSSVLTDAAAFRRERPYAVWVANLKSRKRPEAFLDLACRLEGEALDFLAVGAIHDERYRGWERREGFPAALHFLGPRAPDEVNGIIAGARFLVLTCEPEGFPNVLMQAWNQGRPTLSLGYDPEGMIAANGLGAVALSPDELARLARAWIGDPAGCTTMGERARAFARASFSVEANAEALLEFCAERRRIGRGS